MSAPSVPKISVDFDDGGVTPSQDDIVELVLHLGCTREISSFELLLYNPEGKYTKAPNLLKVGFKTVIGVGRYPNAPQQFCGRIEEIECREYGEEDRALLGYMLVKGRCYGRQLFGQLVTKEFSGWKGEDIVINVIDNYTDLAHVRESSNLTADAPSNGGGKDVDVADGSKFSVGDIVSIQDDNNQEYNEVASIATNKLTMVNALATTYYVADNGKVWISLIEKTDTTYTELQYENTPVNEIVQFIAETADKSGVIGYDFRVEYDGCFAFFAKETKTSPLSLDETLSVGYYKRSISRVRNRVIQEGAIEPTLPRDQDSPWTEPTQDPPENWTAVTANTTLSREGTTVQVGTYSVRAQRPAPAEYMEFYLSITSIVIKERNRIRFWIRVPAATGLFLRLLAPDTSNYFETHSSLAPSGAGWFNYDLPLGPGTIYNADSNPDGTWDENGSPSWLDIQGIYFQEVSPLADPMDIIVDGLHFIEMRWTDMQEDSGVGSSQEKYGIRELYQVDEELHSDDECMYRAKAVLDYRKDPIDTIIVHSDVVDYGTNKLHAGDKGNVKLPHIGIDATFRIASIEIRASAVEQTLHLRLELGKQTPQLADYLYVLRQRVRKSMKYKIES